MHISCNAETPAPTPSLAVAAPFAISLARAVAGLRDIAYRWPPSGVCAREGDGGRVYRDTQRRYRLADEEPRRPQKRRLGLLWQVADGAGGWQWRTGRCADRWLHKRRRQC